MRPTFNTTNGTVVVDDIIAESNKRYYEYSMEWEKSNYESNSTLIFQVGKFVDTPYLFNFGQLIICFFIQWNYKKL